MNDHLGLPYKAALLDAVTFSVHQTAALFQEWQIILQTAAPQNKDILGKPKSLSDTKYFI